VGAVAPLVLQEGRPKRVIAAGVGYTGRRRLVGGSYQVDHQVARLPRTTVVGPSCLAGFYRKSHFAALGGLEPSLGDELADVDYGLRMRRAGLRTVIEPESIVCARPPRTPRSGFHRGLCLQRLRLRNAPSLGREALIRPLTILASLSVRMVQPLRALGHVAGQLTAWSELPRHLRYRRWLDEVREAVAQSIPPHGSRDEEVRREDAGQQTLRLQGIHAEPPRARGQLRISA
jgi:GT2 family glycosyltransferase